jgi:hypothetical protein
VGFLEVHNPYWQRGEVVDHLKDRKQATTVGQNAAQHQSPVKTLFREGNTMIMSVHYHVTNTTQRKTQTHPVLLFLRQLRERARLIVLLHQFGDQLVLRALKGGPQRGAVLLGEVHGQLGQERRLAAACITNTNFVKK